MTNKEKEIVKQLLNRISTCLNIDEICSLSPDIPFLLSHGYKNVKKIEFESSLNNKIIFISYDLFERKKIHDFIKRNETKNIIIAISFNFKKNESYSLSFINSNKRIKIFGNIIPQKKILAPSSFKVLAIIHVYNEEDVIKRTIEYLLSQGIDVYIIDNHSTDNTSNVVKEIIKKYPKRVFYEKYPVKLKSNYFEWSKQLQRTEYLNNILDYNWFIHYDADEIRVSPFSNYTLKNYIYFVDQLGYTLIDNTVIDFRITTHKKKNDIFMKDTYFEFNCRPGSFLQTKTWKKSKRVILKRDGGHTAKIRNPKVFPIKILNKHYPFRSIEQANRKVFVDRKPRYSPKEISIGWHTQYDNIKSEKDFVYQKKELTKFNSKIIKELFLPFFFGVGINNKLN